MVPLKTAATVKPETPHFSHPVPEWARSRSKSPSRPSASHLNAATDVLTAPSPQAAGTPSTSNSVSVIPASNVAGLSASATVTPPQATAGQRAGPAAQAAAAVGLLSAGSQPVTQPSGYSSKDILDKALDKLDEDERANLKKYVPDDGADADAALNAALNAAKEKQAACRKNRWVVPIGKFEVRLRDVADNVVKFLDKFKSVGDSAAGLDPIHAGLAWAGVMVLLELFIAECNSEHLKQEFDSLLFPHLDTTSSSKKPGCRTDQADDRLKHGMA